ncbi:MAG: hypothetical protein ACI9G1_003839, partial [Pirellulaceae bacterium]
MQTDARAIPKKVVGSTRSVRHDIGQQHVGHRYIRRRNLGSRADLFSLRRVAG